MKQTQRSISAISNQVSMELKDYADVLAHLLTCGQKLCEYKKNAPERLCQEIKHVTQGKVRLFLHKQNTSADQLTPSDVCANFPVQFAQRTYGTLQVISDHREPPCAALPLAAAHMLAQTCGLLLHQLELSALLEGQLRRIPRQIYSRLTKREQEVLLLMCRGQTQQEIAGQLQLAPATADTHRKHLFQKLGVHSERDLPLAAYQARFFSLLE